MDSGHRKIRSLMVLHNVKEIDIAKKMGVKQPAVSKVISGINRTRDIRKAIADALNEKVENLWPEPSLKAEPPEQI